MEKVECDVHSMIILLYSMYFFAYQSPVEAHYFQLRACKVASWVLLGCPSRNALATLENCCSNHHRQRPPTQFLCEPVYNFSDGT